MKLKEIINQLNVFQECKKYKLHLWECPSFLFFVMGLIIIFAIIITYQIGMRYIDSPEVVTLIVLAVVVLLMVMNFSITKSFEKLAEANRLKSEFVSIVSHQLRCPLVNLRWAIDYLESEPNIGMEKQKEYFNILKENSNRMGKLVSDLLIISRIETSGFPLQRIKISLAEIVEKMLPAFHPFVEACNTRIEKQFQENLPSALADPDKIKIVLENFIDNATRYVSVCNLPGPDIPLEVRKGRGEIVIKIERRKKDIYFEIKDNGIGIPEEDQKYIFQKFFRARNALKYQTQGTGLGLCINKSIIEKSGGKTGFESKENKGSTFWFTLPINN